MKKLIAALGALLLLVTLGVTMPAQASGGSPPAGDLVCEAIPEVLGHEWQGQSRTLVPEVAEVSHQVYAYKKKVEQFKTERQYQKEVRGDVWQKDNGKKGQWHKTGQKFDWTWWTPASTKWSFNDVEVLESGPHNGVVKEWAEGNGNKLWRWVSTEYRYVKNGTTRQVPDGHTWEHSGEVTEPRDAPWVLLPGYPRTEVTTEHVPAYYTDWTNDGDVVRTDEKVAPEADTDTFRWVYVGTYVKVEGQPANWQQEDPKADCYNGPKFLESGHDLYCGGVDIWLRNVSNWIYPMSVEINGTHSYGPVVDNRADGKLNGPIKDQTGTRTITFEEDSGTHTVRYRVQAGTEKDLYVGKPVGEWTTLTVLTDCEAPEVPEPTVEVEWDEWVLSEWVCGDTETVETRNGTETTTTYKVVGEPGDWSIEVDEVTTKEVAEARTVELTEEQIESKWQYEDPEAPCFNGPEQPDPQQYTDRGERLTCDGLWGWYEMYEVPTVYDPETRTWVPGEPILLESGEDLLRLPSITERIEQGCIEMPPPPTDEPDEPTDEPDEPDTPKRRTPGDPDLPELPRTGANGPAALAGLGGLISIAGAALLIGRRRFMDN